MINENNTEQELQFCKRQLEYYKTELHKAKHIMEFLEEENYSLDFTLLFLYLKEEKIDTESYDASILNSIHFQKWRVQKTERGRYFKRLHKRLHSKTAHFD